MKVKDCNLTKAHTCSKSDNLIKVANKLKETKSRYIIITEKNVPVGVISSSDLVHKATASKKDPEKTKAEDIMTKPICVVKNSEDANKAFIAMVKKGLNSCPVVDENNICIGAISLLELISKLHKNVA